MIPFVANTLGRWLLKRKWMRQERKARAVNLSEVVSVAVLFEFKNETDYDVALRFIDRLAKEEGMFKIAAIGYYDKRKAPGYIAPERYSEVVVRNDFKWYGFPKQDVGSALLQEKFDLLIDLSLDDYFPVTYLAAMTEAKMKVGKKCPTKSFVFDLMIDIGDSHALPYLIEQIMHYVKMINARSYAGT